MNINDKFSLPLPPSLPSLSSPPSLPDLPGSMITVTSRVSLTIYSAAALVTWSLSGSFLTTRQLVTIVYNTLGPTKITVFTSIKEPQRFLK